MGDKDILTKQYVSDNRIFADICNFYIYDGRQVIQPEQLHPLDTRAFALLNRTQQAKNNKLTIDKQRDVLKYLSAMTTNNAAYLILGIENQSDVHYAMPVRNMLYDALQYHHQMQEIISEHRNHKQHHHFVSGFQKQDKLLPVITLVVYFGTIPWDGPTSLHEMLEINDPELLQYVADYQIQLIDPHQLSEAALEKFHSNAKEVFTFIKYANDKTKLAALVQEEQYQALDAAAADVINVCTRAGLKLHTDNEEDVNMCKAIDEMREDSRNEGINEGIEIGNNSARKEMAIALLKKNILPMEEIAALTKLSPDTVEALQQEILQEA